jgi:hypothetical protein
LDPGQQLAQEEGLRRQIVPGVSSAPGFLFGYWTRSADGTESTVFVVFDSAAAAASLADNVRSNAAGQETVGISLRQIQVADVIAHA